MSDSTYSLTELCVWCEVQFMM